jgi:hypothetical protein
VGANEANPAEVIADAALNAAIALAPEGTRIMVTVNQVPNAEPDSTVATNYDDSRQTLTDLLVNASAVAEAVGIDLNLDVG